MSIIVGIHHEGRGVLASDSIVCHSDSHLQHSLPGGKVVEARGGEWAIGATGTFSLVQQLHDFVEYQPQAEDPVDLGMLQHAAGIRSVFTSFDGWLRRRCPWLLQSEAAREGRPLWDECRYLVLSHGGLFEVGASGQARRHDVRAIGIGEEAAMAVVRTLAKERPSLSIRQLAVVAVDYVLAHYACVLGPVNVFTLAPREGRPGDVGGA